MPPTVFLLSPASCAGRRTEVLLNPRADFPLAIRLRAEGAPLGEVFSFLSGLYFRGKLAYARAFASTLPETEGVLVITTHRGLLSPGITITAADVRGFGAVPIHQADARFTGPLAQAAARLAEALGREARIVLLGSIATDKYTHVLLDVFGEQLLFPEAFIGRGDMSRGGLLLRSVDELQELAYIPVRGAARRGSRPPKLAPRK
jgi:hypothetical protein